MKTMFKFSCVLLIMTVYNIHADGNWDGGGDGSTWGDDLNWGGDTEPTASDAISIGANTVIVDTSDAVYSTFNSGSAGGTININSGGTLTSTSTAGHTTLRYLSSININNGGTLVVDDTASLRFDITVNAGGTFIGADGVQDADTLSISGLFRPLDNTNGNNVFALGTSTTRGDLILNTGGTIELDIFGNGVNESFNMFPDTNPGLFSTLDIEDGSIDLVIQGAYTPSIGDSFDLWDDPNGDSIMNVGDGSNISLSGYSLDTSTFATNGVVTVIPEPGSLLLMVVGSLLTGLCLRRR